MLIMNKMPLHDTLRRLMLAVDRVGSRLGGSSVFVSEGGDYEISNYTPSRELDRFYLLHQANEEKDYVIVLQGNYNFKINRAFARMLSQLIDVKNCRWTGQDNSMFDMHDVTEAEFVSLLDLTCGKTKAVRAACIERYIEITIKFFFPESLHQALIEACLNRMQQVVKSMELDLQTETTTIDRKHEELLKAVQPIGPPPTLYFFSSDHIRDKAELHTGHYYGYEIDHEKEPVLFLGYVFSNDLVYIGDEGEVSRAYVSQLFHLFSYDHIRPNGMRPSAGYFTTSRFNRQDDGDCVGEYFECNAEHLHERGRYLSANNPIMVLLLGYIAPGTAHVSYNDSLWYIDTKYLSLVKPETLNPKEHAEQIERNTLIASSDPDFTDVECSSVPISDRNSLIKGKLYGCTNQLFAAAGHDGISRTLGYTHFVSVLYLGPYLKNADGVYIYHNAKEYLFDVRKLHEIVPSE
jgi:hypothetical protein